MPVNDDGSRGFGIDSGDSPEFEYRDNPEESVGDYSRATDYSLPTGHDNGLGEPSASAPSFRPPGVAQDLREAEHNVVDKYAKNDKTAQYPDVPRRETAAVNHDNPLGYTPDKNRNNHSAEGKIKSSVKKWAIGAILGIGTAGAAGAGLMGMASLPETLMSKFLDGTMNVSNGVLGSRYGTVLRNFFGKGCSAGVSCKFHTMPQRTANKLRDNGFKLLDSSGNEITGSGRLTNLDKIEVPSSLKAELGDIAKDGRLTANNITKAMDKSPALRKALKNVYDPKFAGFSDRVFAKALERLRAAKKSSIPKDGETSGDEAAVAKANETALEKTVNEGASVAGGTAHAQENTDEHGNKTYEALDENNKPILDTDSKPITAKTADEATKAGQQVLDDAAKALDDAVGTGGEKAAKKAVLDAGKNATETTLGKVLGVFSMTGNILNYPCGVLNGLRALNFGVKIIRNAQLIRLFIDFAAAVGAAQAGDGDPNQVGFYLGKLLTGVVDSSGVATTAMDSVYMANLMFGDRLGDDESSTQFKAAATFKDVMEKVGEKLFTKESAQ